MHTKFLLDYGEKPLAIDLSRKETRESWNPLGRPQALGPPPYDTPVKNASTKVENAEIFAFLLFEQIDNEKTLIDHL